MSQSKPEMNVKFPPGGSSPFLSMQGHQRQSLKGPLQPVRNESYEGCSASFHLNVSLLSALTQIHGHKQPQDCLARQYTSRQ